MPPKCQWKLPVPCMKYYLRLMPLPKKGNSNAITDACVSMMCARTAILGALLNVRINLTSIKDEVFVNAMREEADTIEAHTILQEQALLEYAKTKL